MEVSRIRALRGPNLWSRHTAIEAMVQCAPEHTDLRQLPDFESRLRHLFPGMGHLQATEHKAKVSLAHALESATLNLQTEAGCPVTFSRTTATPDAGLYQVVVEYTEEPVGRLALNLAQQLVQAALTQTEFDLDAALHQLRELDEDIRLGPSTGSIVDAAVARGIPYRRLTEGSLVQFGWGAKQRRIQAAEIDRTSAIAESIAQDKELTKKLLDAAGVPVPKGRPVKDADDAWLAAQQIGLPVVVKPRDGNQGKGVTVNISQREEVQAAYEVAEQYGNEVLVERFLPGSDYRLLVVGERLVAAARREPPLVIGDGKHTVRQLVDKVNADPRRGDGHATSLTRIRLDEIALALAQGARILLLDEPTSTLGPMEVERLIHCVRDLASEGVAVGLVTHRIVEVLKGADRVTVLRGGRLVHEGLTHGLSVDDLATFMVGERERHAPVRGDRKTGEVLQAEPFVFVNWAKSIDLKSGRPVENPEKRTSSSQNTKDICPSAMGGKNQQPVSYSPRTKLFYVPTNNLCMDYEGVEVKYQAGQPYVGAIVVSKAGPGGNRGEFIAWDPTVGKKV